MPLIAALTPPEHLVSHTDEIVEPVRFDVAADLVGITTSTPSAFHAYRVAREFRDLGVPVVIGGPHATALPEEAARHADAVVVGEAAVRGCAADDGMVSDGQRGVGDTPEAGGQRVVERADDELKAGSST